MPTPAQHPPGAIHITFASMCQLAVWCVHGVGPHQQIAAFCQLQGAAHVGACTTSPTPSRPTRP
jgi:hypothetical protein